MSYSNQAGANAHNAALDPGGRIEGALTGRIRALNEQADQSARRLDRILQTLRGAPPPSPAGAGSVVRQSCISDYLGQHESTHKNIEEMLTEIETLIG